MQIIRNPCCHCACLPDTPATFCRFALPALLPLITPDLQLTEQQGALLTAGYAVRSYHGTSH